jgi:hypothetical protein
VLGRVSLHCSSVRSDSDPQTGPPPLTAVICVICVICDRVREWRRESGWIWRSAECLFVGLLLAAATDFAAPDAGRRPVGCVSPSGTAEQGTGTFRP